MKKSVCFLLAALIGICSFSACGKTDDGKKEGNKATVTISQSTLDLYEYESGRLNATAENTGEKIVWTTSDDKIATVGDDGTVTAVSIGNTVVTASAGGAEAVCKVFVAASPYAPIIKGADSFVGVTAGKKYSSDIYVSWNGEKIEGVAFNAVLTGESDEGVAAVGIENGKLTVEGLNAGTAEYSVYATVRGKFCEKTIKIAVYREDVVVDAKTDDFTRVESGFRTTIITAEDDSGMPVEVALDFEVTVGGEVIKNPEIVWDVNADYNADFDKNKACVKGDAASGYKLSALLRGETKLVGKYVTDSSVTFISVIVSVVTPTIVVPKDKSVFVERKNPSYTADGSFEGELRFLEIDGKTASESVYGSSATIKKSALTGEDNELSETELYVYTDKYCYVVPIKICTEIINTRAKLEGLKLTKDADGKDSVTFGYYVLVGDLDLGGAEMTGVRGKIPYDSDLGFKGVLDGNGFSIKNFIAGRGGIFGHIGSGAVIKNVKFEDVTYKAISEAALFGHTLINMTIENVTVNVKRYNKPADIAKTDVAIFGARFFMYNTVKNVTVNAAGVTFLNLFGHKCVDNSTDNFVINAAGYVVIGYNSDSANDSTEIKSLPDGVIFNVTA